MIRYKIAGLAIAAIVTAGLGGASAFAATADSPASAPAPKPTPSASPTDRDAMIRHCTDHLPAGDRAKARQQMQKMMSGDMMSGRGGSMMGDTPGSGSTD